MKDNYPESGKTYTAGWGMLDQDTNPLISVNTHTTTPTTVVTSTPTTVKTTVATTIPTMVTTPVGEVTTLLPTPPVVTATATQTKSPGFEPVLAGTALLIALAWSVRKE
jgi:hypothetical protein